MGRFIIFVTAVVALTVFFSIRAAGQTPDTTKAIHNKIKVQPFANVSLVSQYLWRGTMLDGKPNIQPLLGLGIGGFEVGVFGSVSVLNPYREADLYASYTYKFFKLTVTDFFIDSGFTKKSNYFDYSKSAMGHTIVCDLTFLGTKKFPVKIMASTVLYGGLDSKDSANSFKSRYTTYLEARWLHKGWEVFAGVITGQSSFYFNVLDKDGKNYVTGKFGIVNVGVAYTYNIVISDKYSVPVFAQASANPQMNKFYFTFGVTF